MSNSDLAKRYIGKQISLISTSHVRYEGYLYTIDEQAQTVALQNVVCMGTEGRRHGDQAIGPSDTTYEFIIFRGVNIQHFYVKSDESLGKPTVDKTQELFAALGIDDDEAMYGGGRDYRGSGSRNKERPSSRLVPLDDTPKRRVGRGDFSPRDNFYQQPYQQRNYYPPRDWDRYPNYPRGGYPRGPMPRRRDRDRGRRYDDGGYDNRPPQRRGGPDPDRQRGDGGRRRGGGGRSPNRMNGGNQGGGRRQQSRRNNNNRGRSDNNRRDRQNSNRQSNRPSGGGGGNVGGNAGGKRKQAGTGEFLTKAGRGEELEINENQLFDFEEAKTKFTRASDVDVKAAEDMGEIKASAEVENPEENNTEASDDKKISEPSEVDMGGQELNATDDANVTCYDPSNSFFDFLSTDNAQRSKTGRPDMNEQRNVDAKTFGSIAQTYKSSHLRSAGGNRGEKSRNRRPNNQKPKRNRRRTNERSRRQRAPPVQRQWQPRQY